ncbi:hypothetical protein D3C78_1557170 [compost metagenome]
MFSVLPVSAISPSARISLARLSSVVAFNVILRPAAMRAAPPVLLTVTLLVDNASSLVVAYGEA